MDNFLKGALKLGTMAYDYYNASNNGSEVNKTLKEKL